MVVLVVIVMIIIMFPEVPGVMSLHNASWQE